MRARADMVLCVCVCVCVCVCHSVAFALPCAAFVPKRNLPQELHPHISVDIAAVWDDCRADKITSHTIRSPTICSPTRPPELQYEHYTLEDPAKKLPLDRRPLKVTIQVGALWNPETARPAAPETE